MRRMNAMIQANHRGQFHLDALSFREADTQEEDVDGQEVSNGKVGKRMRGNEGEGNGEKNEREGKSCSIN